MRGRSLPSARRPAWQRQERPTPPDWRNSTLGAMAGVATAVAAGIEAKAGAGTRADAGAEASAGAEAGAGAEARAGAAAVGGAAEAMPGAGAIGLASAPFALATSVIGGAMRCADARRMCSSISLRMRVSRWPFEVPPSTTDDDVPVVTADRRDEIVTGRFGVAGLDAVDALHVAQQAVVVVHLAAVPVEAQRREVGVVVGKAIVDDQAEQRLVAGGGDLLLGRQARSR